MLSALEDDISESEKESMKDCAACAFMANKIRQLKNKLKSLQNKLIAVRKERFYSRRTAKRQQAQKNLQTDQDQVETACSKESEPMEETASSTEGDTDDEDLDDGEEEEEMEEDDQSYNETETETTETEDEDELKSNRLFLKNTNLRTEPKHIVFLSQLFLLFKFCHVCKADNPMVEASELGTEAVVKNVFSAGMKLIQFVSR
ncbi:glutamic acid-rich protein-like [Acropora millepora]|uniref:glutamic acid-rich protein-like n=1 Tax=Acropora millepora TaxID=45264 RepID=UPI001CF4216B|nr:glutamic acid-rich protein-like [Acropora millepora]